MTGVELTKVEQAYILLLSGRAEECREKLAELIRAGGSALPRSPVIEVKAHADRCSA